MADSTRRSSGPVLQSLFPTTKFHSPSQPSSSAFASSSSAISSRSTLILDRSTAPPCVNNLYASAPPSPSLRLSFDRPISPSPLLSVSARNQEAKRPAVNRKLTCMCSPTTHPGSFRCSFHKNLNSQKLSFPSNRLDARRSAMTNSLVRIGKVEGDLVRRALAAMIWPSSHQQRRRAGFHPSPSRLSIVSNSDDL